MRGMVKNEWSKSLDRYKQVYMRAGKLKILKLTVSFLVILSITPATISAKFTCAELMKSALGGLLLPLMSMPIGRFMYVPATKLASWPGGEVAGFLKNADSFKGMAKTLAEKLNGFDHHLESLGFVGPKSSRFVLFNRRAFSRHQDTYMIGVPAFNLWKGKLQIVTAIDEPLRRQSLPKVVEDGTILLHERAHAFVLYTYGTQAFHKQGTTIQEALADFFVVHQSGNPRIGTNLLGDGTFARDVDRKASYFIVGKSETLFSLDNVIKHKNQHFDSLFLSNILWEVRKGLGVEATSGILKRFVDNLNLYRSDFENVYYSEIKDKKSHELKFVANAEYFLAVLKRTATEAQLEVEALAEVDRIVAKAADELESDLNFIEILSQNIVKSSESLQYSRSEELILGTAFSTTATVGLLIKGAIAWFLVTIFFSSS